MWRRRRFTVTFLFLFLIFSVSSLFSSPRCSLFLPLSLSLSLSSLLRLPAGNASTDQFISPLVPVSRVYASLNDGN